MLHAEQTYTTLPVADIERARAFYEKMLGFRATEMNGQGILYETGHSGAFLIFPSSGKPSGDHTQMTFMVADLEREVRELADSGVRFEAVEMEGYDPETSIVSMDGFRGAWFRDPEGNLLAITQPAEQG